MVVSIAEFAKSPEFLGLKLYPKQAEVLKNFYDPKKDYRELVLLCGKGSGKDFLASIILAYSVYWLEELPDPQGYLGMGTGENIDLINVATTSDQSVSIFFSRFKARLEFSPYFSSLAYKSYSDRIYFPNHVAAFSSHSRSEVFEGKNIFIGILDEASAFEGSGTYGNADSVYRTLTTSMYSRFPKYGRICVLSYPRKNIGDFTADLYETKLKDPKALCVKAKTWELNNGITREDLQPFYSYDAGAARRMFECDLTAYSSEMFTSVLVDGMSYVVKPIVTSHNYVTRKLGREYIARKIDSIAKGEQKYTISIDTGLRGSKLAMIVGHLESDKAVVDQLVEWAPIKDAEVDFENVFDFIINFGQVNTIVKIYLDQWNSALLEQMLRSAGIFAEKCNFGGKLKWQYYNDMNVMLKLGKVELPKDVKVTDAVKVLENPSEGVIAQTTDTSDALALFFSKLASSVLGRSTGTEKAKKKKPFVMAS